MPTLPPAYQARSPAFFEVANAAFRIVRNRRSPLGAATPETQGTAHMISREPLVIASVAQPNHPAPLGYASAMRREIRRMPITFLFQIWFSLEFPTTVKRYRRAAMMHRLLCPHHTLIALCNTEKERRMLAEVGEPAVFLNHNLFVDPRVFRPLPGAIRKYDAVYNARLSPQKRHEFSLKIDTCAMIGYRGWEALSIELDIIARHNREAPGHVFVNEVGPNGLVFIPRERVNEIYNEAHVGLCLSEAEGAMLSSIEYLMAGLPVVNTINVGGRDVYFDPDYVITVPPDADAVRNAVLELKARNIPPDYVRQRTLEKVKMDRERFLNLLSDLSVQLPPETSAFENWPFPGPLISNWIPYRQFHAAFGL
jgi:glycosyltransferase involved in cell wall biosynthesis